MCNKNYESFTNNWLSSKDFVLSRDLGKQLRSINRETSIADFKNILNNYYEAKEQQNITVDTNIYEYDGVDLRELQKEYVSNSADSIKLREVSPDEVLIDAIDKHHIVFKYEEKISNHRVRR